MQAASGFEALPAALHLHILSFLPLVERVRCASVARSWAALLADPASWAELRFDGAADGSVDDETLLKLCRRAGGRLRALDVSGPACEAVTTDGLCNVLATDGLGLALESLRTWAPADGSRRQSTLQFTRAAATALAAACPALASAAVDVSGTYADTAAVFRILPGPGEKCLVIVSKGDGPEASLPALADWVCTALGGSTIAALDLLFRLAVPSTEMAEQEASARLAAALTAPERGLRSLSFEGVRGTGVKVGRTPILASLCHALTAESPLTELSLEASSVTGAGAAEIAAALASGRSRLRTLNLSSNDLSDGNGGEALLSALEANTTLTKLDLEWALLGGQKAAAALAASLRSNSTLRTLNLHNSTLGSPPEGIAPVLSALVSTAEAPSICSLTALDLREHDLTAAECTALGLALAQPACQLETLDLSSCGAGDAGGAAIVHGLELAGAASRLRSLDLSYNGLGDAAAATLGRVLAAQGPDGALRKLHLTGNLIGPDAAEQLAEGLRVNSSLGTLDLGVCFDLGLEGAGAIVRGIAGTAGTASGVKALSLARCGLGDESAAAMLEAGLERNATLTELDVNGNRLGEAGCLALAKWAAIRFGVATECPPPEGVALPSGAHPSALPGPAGAAGEAVGSTGGGGAQQQSLPASPGTARLPHASLLGTGGSQQQPSPLTLKLSTDNLDEARMTALAASLGRIVERANAAAAAAGWRYGKRRNALALKITV